MANVCSIDYIGKRFEGNRAGEISVLHLQVENDFRAFAGNTVKANNTIHQFVLKNERDMATLNKARAAVRIINAHYGATVVQSGKYNGSKDYYNVNVTDLILKRDKETKEALEKINKDPYRVVDGEIINPSDYDGFYQRKAVNLEGTPLDTLESFFKKAELMQNTFKNKGIDVYVMLDGDQIEPGQVLADNSKTVNNLRTTNVIGQNTKVISVNPNMLYNDVITHEFAHLFIDVLGGLSNSRINAAFTKLIGTDIYNKVAELYPELEKESDKFKKEVIATALGVEGNKVFENNQVNKTWWDSFRDWVFSRMQSIFGNIDKDSIKSLAEDMINGNFIPTTNVSPDNYFRKTESKLTQATDKQIKDLDDANKQISININKMITTFEKRTGNKITPINPSESYEAYVNKKVTNRMSQQAFNLSKLKAINEAIGRLQNKHYEKYILSYIDVAIEGIHRNLDQLKAIDKSFKNRGKREFDIEKSIKLLESIKISNESFELLERLSKNVDEFTATPEVKKLIKDSIKIALAEKNESHNKFISVAKEILVERLKGLEDIILAEKKEQLEVEYNQTKNDATGRVKADEVKEDFIARMLNESKEEILEETEDFVRENLLKSVTDVGDIEFFLRSEKSMNAMTIRLASRLLDKASYNSSKAFIEKRAEAQEIFEAYNAKHGSVNQKQMWSPLTQEIDGEIYLKSKYNPKFYEEYKAITAKVKEVKESDKSTEEDVDAVLAEYSKWLEDNTEQRIDEVDEVTVRVPKPKWLNSEYSKIMSTPNSPEAKMLKFLEKTISQSDNNYSQKLKLARTPFGNAIEESAVFYRMPAMGRDTLEKAIGGDYLANAKDTFERFTKFKDDDPERFGELLEEAEANDNFDSKTMKKVISNTQGEEKHNIPIYFRRKFDPKTSTYDFMTAVMSDYYMSSQFKEKTEIQPLLELLLTVTANKEVGDSVGIKNLNKVFSINDKEYQKVEKEGINSREYEKLKSLIENRLYNITTTDAEFGKVAQTVMAWTGSVMMSLNFFSGVANVMQGKVTNFLESAGSTFYDSKNVANAEKKFFADMGGWMNDLGSVTNRSKTRLLIDLLNVQGDFIGVKERYIRSSRGLALASRKNLTAPNTVGEFYTQATLMYAMMDKIKVKDKSGNYLDKDFKPTKDKTKAISLDESITVEKGILKVHPSVHSTTFSENANGNIDTILEETRVYVKKVSSDLHGQYDKELASHFQRGTWGKFTTMFRKWLVPGFDRRWRGTANLIGKKENRQTYEDLRGEDQRKNRFFSSDLKQFQEGTYTSFIRMMQSLHEEGNILAAFTMSLDKTKTWDLMTDTEKGNVKKAVAEYATIILTLASAYILKGLAADLPEDDPAYSAMMLAAFSARRLHMELFAFSNPLEAFALMKSPAASVSLLQKSGRLLIQMLKDTTGLVFTGEDFEVYERGDMKGEFKLKKYFFDVVPVANQINRNLDDAVTYMFQTY
jgi:hypothetical protein